MAITRLLTHSRTRSPTILFAHLFRWPSLACSLTHAHTHPTLHPLVQMAITAELKDKADDKIYRGLNGYQMLNERTDTVGGNA
jgi:hypothetical protein